MRPVAAAAVGFLLTLASPVFGQQSDTPTPPIHPNDMTAATVQQRIHELERSGNTADQAQLNALRSLLLQGRNMNDAARLTGQSNSLSPTPPTPMTSTPPYSAIHR
jgi:hypothetical protein